MNTETTKIKSLLKTLSRIHSSLNIEEVLENSLREIVNLIGSETGSIWEIDEKKQELFFRSIIGTAAPVLKNKRLKIGEGIAGMVAATGKSLIINDVKKSKQWKEEFDRESDFKTKNLLNFPLTSGGKVIGVIQLLNKKEGFTNQDLRLLSILGAPISIALENAKLYSRIKKIFKETSLSLATAIEKRDPYTGGHTKRVLTYSSIIGKSLGLADAELEQLELSAILHDIGKIGIPDAILRKKELLNEEERKIIEKHPLIGAEIVMEIEGMEKILGGIKYHHERCNGSGYPEGLSCNKIPLFAKIIAVADVFDALTTERPYKKAMSFEEALIYLWEKKGTEFWPPAIKALKEELNSQVLQYI